MSNSAVGGGGGEGNKFKLNKLVGAATQLGPVNHAKANQMEPHHVNPTEQQPRNKQQPKPATDAAAPGKPPSKQLVAPSPAGAAAAATAVAHRAPQKSNSAQHRRQQQRKQPYRPAKVTIVDVHAAEIDVELNKFPYSIVWCPLPVVSWFLPLIGHTGITNSRGVIYDFSDDFQVSVDNFSFGSPTKFYQLDVGQLLAITPAVWDAAINEQSEYYSRTRHSFCFNNCHEYIAEVLNKVRYDQSTAWSQYHVWTMITFRSSYVDALGFLRQWGPFVGILATVVLVVVLLVVAS